MMEEKHHEQGRPKHVQSSQPHPKQVCLARVFYFLFKIKKQSEGFDFLAAPLMR